MEGAASGSADAAGVRSAAAESDGREIYHLIRKCDLCKQSRRNPRQCFNKGHEQLIRTVRASENGTTLECMASGEVLDRNNDGDKFYHYLKPASRVFAWDDHDQISEVPWAHLSDLETVAMAEGTVLLRSIPPKPVTAWLGKPDTQEVVEDYLVPPRIANRESGSASASARPSRIPGWEWVESEDSAPERGAGDDAGEGTDHQGSRKRKGSSPAAAAAVGGDGGAQQLQQQQQQQQQEEGASQKAAKRRASRRPGAGVRVSPVGSGGKLGDVGGSGADGGCPAQMTNEGAPSLPNPATKEGVDQVLTGKLRACDKREQELTAVIEKATAELQKNSERRKAAVAESERQLLSIIAHREAKAAHYEQLAAQARAQNKSDRESLQAHKEQVQKDVGLVVTVGGAASVAGAATAAAAAAATAAAAAKVSHKAIPGVRDAQAAVEESAARPGKGAVQAQKDRGAGRARASGAGVTESSSWSIGAQAARLAQAQPVQAPAPAVATAVQAPPSTSAKAGAAAAADAAAAAASSPRPLSGEYKTKLEAEKARVREKLHLVEKELLQLDKKGAGAGSSSAAAAPAAEAQLLPAAPTSAVMRPTASLPASLLVRNKSVPDVTRGMARTNTVGAPSATATTAPGSAAVSVIDASSAATLAVTPSDSLPSNKSAMVADVSRAVISAAAPAVPAAAPLEYTRMGEQAVSPCGDGGGSAPSLAKQRVRVQAGGKIIASAGTPVAGGALRQDRNKSTLAIASAAPNDIMRHGWEPRLHPSTSGGAYHSRVVGGATAAASTETTAIAAAAEAAATATAAATEAATMAKNNGNASRSDNDASKTLLLSDLFTAGGP